MNLTADEERVLNQLLTLAEQRGLASLADKVRVLRSEMEKTRDPAYHKEVESELEKRKRFNDKFVSLRKRKLTELDYKQITIDTFQIEIENLNNLNATLSSELNEKRSKLHLEIAELEELKIQYERLNKELESVEKRRKAYVGDLEKKIEGMRESIYSRELKYLIILELLKMGYIKDPTYDILMTLKRSPAINTVERLAQVSNVNPRSIKNIFIKLQQHGIVSWDMNKETFHIVKELEI